MVIGYRSISSWKSQHCINETQLLITNFYLVSSRNDLFAKAGRASNDFYLEPIKRFGVSMGGVWNLGV